MQTADRSWWAGFDRDAVQRILTSDYPLLISWLNQVSQDRDLRTGRGQSLRFGVQSVLPEGTAYEYWIAQTGMVPTRDNLHDRINALVWLTYPQTKAALNREQARVIETQSESSRRGPLRDAATLWDENLAIVIDDSHDQRFQQLLTQADWPAIFLTHRQAWQDTWQILCFGHALLEKLLTPYKAITAHTIILRGQSIASAEVDFSETASADHSDIDLHLSALISPSLSPSFFRPLPVMGIPGWDSAQHDQDFYRDTSVFRPPRAS